MTKTHWWYHSTRWYRLRNSQLRREPLCRHCKQEGKLSLATVVDHVIPHRDDPTLFWKGELQSLCTTHHSSGKQREEALGYSTQIGVDGVPVDPRHPGSR